MALALGQLPLIVSVITKPAISVFDRAFGILLLLGALSLFSLGVFRLRTPEQFDDGSTESEFRTIPMLIIASGLIGSGALMYMIAS